MTSRCSAGGGSTTWTPPEGVRTWRSAINDARCLARRCPRQPGAIATSAGERSGNQLPKLMTSAWNEPPGDDAVDMLEQQHFGEEILILRARLQLAHGLVADFQQLRARHRVLVFLEPLQNEFLIFLLERPRCTTHRCHAGLARLLEREGRQHGSTCTVTASSSRSFFSRASTASAIAWASATFAAGSTASVTSA